VSLVEAANEAEIFLLECFPALTEERQEEALAIADRLGIAVAIAREEAKSDEH